MCSPCCHVPHRRKTVKTPVSKIERFRESKYNVPSELEHYFSVSHTGPKRHTIPVFLMSPTKYDILAEGLSLADQDFDLS